MRVAEVRVNAWLCKRVLVNKALVGKNSRNAVRIVRRTKLRIHRARRTTGDAVAAFGPGPSYRVAYGDVDRVRYEDIAPFSDGHIEDLTRTRRNAAHSGLAVLIHNLDPSDSGPFLLRRPELFVTGFSLRRKYHRKRHHQQKSDACYCVRSFHGFNPFFSAPGM